jgi:TorA maturation chaperone TorD
LQPERSFEQLTDEDRTRAQLYALLGRLLTTAPQAALLEQIAGFTGDGSELGQALAALAATARKLDAGRVSDEYQDVMVGVTRGEVVPYASYYLTGFLHSKPLANLRGDMAVLGIARQGAWSSPRTTSARSAR